MDDSTTEEPRVRRQDRAHVFHSWSAQARIDPMPVARAEGVRFYDYQGRGYLDFASQLVNANLGHQHPTVVAAIREQADRLCTIAPGFANDVRGELAALVAERGPAGMSKVFFTNGGADAVENAIRMARQHTGRLKVLSAYRSYHGNTAAAISATGDPRRWANEPSVPGTVHFFGPYPYRSAFGVTDEREECARALAHLEQVIALEGPDTVAAVLLETVVGTNGVLVPPDGYLAGVREICDRYGVLLVCDEVMCGFGRVGEWFACQHWDVVPDLIPFAKGINSGYVPLGGVLIGDAVAETFEERAFPGGLTYSGHPLACAAGVGSIRAFEEEHVLEHVSRLGEDVVRPSLEDLAGRHPSIGEVRGLGMLWAIELVRDRETREMLVPFNASGADAEPMARVMAACKERGVWPFTHFNRLHVAPPLVIDEADLKEGIAVIDDALDIADEYVAG
ncbi:MAG: aspartate aminotransferase family protein [Marmoricola sp.]